jgi:hypothetical protein
LKKIFCSFALFLFIAGSVSAQTDSCNLRISLLTASPGEELYSTFGHSALRVYDSASATDIIYNYGTFDFDDPQFYSKFVRGKLLYFVSVDNFQNFMYQYEYEKRGITEQVLNLSCAENEKLFKALIENAKEENKYYKYDFVYDNCTTRLLDIVAANSNDSLITKNIRPYNGVTFRNLIHEYLDKGHQYWSKFGIDLLLGTPLDKKISNQEAMFLPDYLLKAFDHTTTGNKKLVIEKKSLLEPAIEFSKNRVFTPMIIFCFLFLLVMAGSFSNNSFIKQLLMTVDFLFFFLTGLVGILLLFMWFGTEHLTTKQNFNLAWAFPLNVVMAFFVHKKSRWVKNYFRFIFLLTFLLLLSWFFLPQQLNIAALPLAGIILVRSWLISKRKMYGRQAGNY